MRTINTAEPLGDIRLQLLDDEKLHAVGVLVALCQTVGDCAAWVLVRVRATGDNLAELGVGVEVARRVALAR